MIRDLIKKASDETIQIILHSYEDGEVDMELGEAIFSIKYNREYENDCTAINVENVRCSFGDHPYPNVVNAIWDYFESLKDKLW